MKTNFKNRLGYVTDVQGLHICGYIGQVVFYQDNSNGTGKKRGTKLHTNSKGTYFNFKGKRVFVDRV
jgi:hypothetical protein